VVPEFGLVLCRQFPPGDDATARFAEQVQQVHHARDHGFTSVWATQHYLAEEVQYLHPLAVLGRLVPETGDMRIGTAITLMALAHPVDLAEQFATLDILSGGRLVVSAGLGYRDVEFDAFGVPRDRRLRRFRENLDRTAATGLPWLAAAAHVDADYLRTQAAFFRARCAEHGRDAEINVLQEVYVGATDDEAVEDVREALAAKYATYRSWGQDKILPESQSFDREFDELRRGRFILGRPDTCRARLAELIDTVGPAHVLLRPQWPGLPHERVMASLRRLTAEVLPGLAEVAV
jgi:alkanesulfonate monooxygenase SsuD/methylene tetrahydromethanopterin reductase-like flavin-dependent oxidoreductase (luciferase family)